MIEDAEQGARKFLDWCASTTRTWLLVFDDVADPADVQGLWPSTGAHGRLVVTTRRNERWALQTATQRLVPLDVFTEAESAEYLRGVLGDVPGVSELAALLGHLPLALSQAAAHLAMTPGMTCLGYVEKWRTKRATLAEMFPEDWSGPGARTATTWSISIDAADQLPPAGLARPMLAVMSLLDPNGIPLSVLTADPVLKYLSTGSGQEVNAETASRALGCLARLNLITVDTEVAGTNARVHALIQRATRDQVLEDRIPVLTQVAADALVDSWPTIERDSALGARLRANTATLAEYGEGLLDDTGTHSVLFRAGSSLGRAGQVHTAVAYHRDLLSRIHHHLGSEHSDAFDARANLALWQAEAGDVAESVRQYTLLIADKEQARGLGEASILTTRANLAGVKGEASDFDGAVADFSALLADAQRIYGPDHVATLVIRSNLIYWTAQTGDTSTTVSDYTDLLADQLRVLGPDHPETLICRANLASRQGQAGDVVGAMQAYAELLADRLRVLGPDHPNTLIARANLAYWQGRLGDVRGAIQALTKLLAHRLRILGPDHPATLGTRQSLVYWQRRHQSLTASSGGPGGGVVEEADHAGE
ncbi:tetratricopeptide (TPR) repeat protein [Actinokineospora baliensis]|uniref:tetratricopeptide repeat protein n=1 Tax=Actinokineospora baliensis TaxID=547056 RepID=UPI0019566157|nr:tetratricopeptide repeat protein [Actinokineospora baliensis]MBM7773950.1 tetratricopeptide (TPR) repeat protein [Actinokineospora baliensis]